MCVMCVRHHLNYGNSNANRSFALGSSWLAEEQLSLHCEITLLSQVSRSLGVAEGAVAEPKAGLKPLHPPPLGQTKQLPGKREWEAG